MSMSSRLKSRRRRRFRPQLRYGYQRSPKCCIHAYICTFIFQSAGFVCFLYISAQSPPSPLFVGHSYRIGAKTGVERLHNSRINWSSRSFKSLRHNESIGLRYSGFSTPEREFPFEWRYRFEGPERLRHVIEAMISVQWRLPSLDDGTPSLTTATQ